MGDQASFDLAPFLAECLLMSFHETQATKKLFRNRVTENPLNRTLTTLLDLLSALAESEKVDRESKTIAFESIWALSSL